MPAHHIQVPGRPIHPWIVFALFLLSACQPTVRVEAPKEPITINLNVKVDAEVRVKLEQQAQEDVNRNSKIF